ncbi:hypothetical protein JHK87_050009 [Glycine soja]|nr:hypothetical protein JHK87_050009 [Glycine soja]
MDKLHNRAKGYIQMEEKSRFWNEVRQAIQKRDMHKANTKANLHKLDKRHKPDKSQLLFKGPRCERYTPLTINRMMILKEAFNLEVPIWLPQTKAPRPGSSSSRAIPLISYTRKPSRDLSSHPIPSTPTQVHSSALQLAMPYPTVAEGTQVMKRDEGSQIRALTIYQSSLGSEFDTDLQDDTSDKDPKLIEELVQLQPGPKPR